MHLPPAIARARIMEGATRGNIAALNSAFACTDDEVLINDASEALTATLFRKCLQRATDAYAHNEDFILHMQAAFRALMDAQLDPRPLLGPPGMVLHLYSESAATVERGTLERATDMILSSMWRGPIDFNAVDLDTGMSLLACAIERCGCNELVLNRLFDCGCAFTDDELALGTALAAIIRRPAITLTVMHQLCFRDRLRGWANARIEPSRDGGTVLHMVCREVPIERLEHYLNKLVTGLRVSPALLNDNGLAPHQILQRERLTADGLGPDDVEVLELCVRSLVDAGGAQHVHATPQRKLAFTAGCPVQPRD